ncbi:unnamed protein product [Paramecium octaurelia]|uniref:Uncharacterized protein n=1 Tax=Paramecium octaurelia TaxID=43137 RepID=A0A8S1UAL6_PAROT|nr:unnamed protein product [Paramecium octaurelia]
MAERNISENSLDSKWQSKTQSTNEDKITGLQARPYNYNCQLDQYNVKLCGLVFDAIGVPDFFVQCEHRKNSQTDVLQ